MKFLPLRTPLHAIAGALAAVALSCASPAVHAHAYSAAIKAKKYAEVEQAASAKLATDPQNAEALIARVDLIVAQGQEARLEEAVKLAEQCIAAHPQKSECHEALGNALGTKAMMGGIMSAIGYATDIRDAFKKAVELDAKNLDARFSLLTYYQQAPGIVGGGSGKAKDLAAETAKVHPEAGKLMQAAIALADEDFAKAEALALSANPKGSDVMVETQRNTLYAVGGQQARNKQYAEAQRVFADLEKRYPDSALGAFGQARVMQEQGKHADALPLLERALSVDAAAHIHYRLGQSLQAVNDKARAVAAYEKALGFKPALSKKQRADAQDQLKTLKS